MKKWLLASVCLLALMGAPRADVPVIDAGHIALDVKNAAIQLAQMKKDYEVAIGTFSQLVRGVNPMALAGKLLGGESTLGSVGSMAGSVMGIGRDTMGVVNMVRGIGMTGFNMNAMMGSILNQNTYYSPPGNDFQANWIRQQGTTLASYQTLALRSLQDAQDRLTGIDEIQAELGNVSSQADLVAIQGRIQGEAGKVQAMQLQMASLSAVMTAQQQSYDLQQMQANRKSADEFGTKAGTTVIDNGVAPATANAMPTTFSALNGG